MRLSFWNNQKIPYSFHVKKCDNSINARDLPNTPIPKQIIKQTDCYDYGARYYNPKTSLWLSVDPLAEKYPGVSSYTYCVNNPVYFIDPDGMQGTDWVKGINGKIFWDDRVKDQKSANKYYSGSKWLGDVHDAGSKNGLHTYYRADKKILSLYDSNPQSYTTINGEDKTPELVSVNITHYLAVETKSGMMINKTHETTIKKYQDIKDGWIGANDSRVTILFKNGKSMYIDNGICPRCSFDKTYPNARDIGAEISGYKQWSTMGNAFGRVGTSIEIGGYLLSVPTEGASLIVVPIGKTVGYAGTAMSIYGDYMQGEYESIFWGAVENFVTGKVSSTIKSITTIKK